ncbi:hypothetical protein CHLRE_03g152950v5 [Chlamydomonas reinhardtii]|uniref:Pseudouridine synthase I TruA alpha/beta domain-containing protein n=1 Tax=Chlamydomonas reinhardtii TaxID=3055 RepID=A0A2K3DVV0_CHLRE|nr:uncharacterized protein CHLRE_03g152950v5 [Chlamydomonas reinhardtii]PNW84649.1 hypothetical protein CHLRE_03g152950v5 [Chlamydomonas reinhardtii]
MEEPRPEPQGSGENAPAPQAAAAGEEVVTVEAKAAACTACGDDAPAAAGDGAVLAGTAAAAGGGRPKDRAKRSVALHTGYVGTGFKGSSINRTLGENVTIEQVLEKALFAAGCISEANFGSFSKIRWSRASRTDKGVHSLGTVMGLRMLVDDAKYVAGPDGDCEGLALAEAVNTHLPPQIRVFTVQKTNKKFSARHMCEGRVYQYYLPVSMIDLKCDGSEEDAQRLAKFRDALKCYEGSHPFHNFTKRVTYQPGGSNVQFRPGRGKRGRGDGDDSAPAAADAGTEGDAKQEPQAADAAAGDAAAADKEAGAAAGPEAADTAAADQQAAKGTEPEAKRQKQDPEAAQAAGADGAGERGGRGRGGRGGRGAGGRGGGGGRKRRGSDDEDEEEEEDEEGGAGELDDDDDMAAAAAAAAAQEGKAGEPNSGNAADGDGVVGRYGPYGRVLLLRWQTEVDPRDRITQTFYRRIYSFTAADPKPMVEGGEPCLLLEVSGQSFMLHHIRHMIGAAVAVTLGLISKEVLLGSLTPPARVTLPRAPPHTLLLSDCSFGRFPAQQGPGDNDLRNITGERLSLREGGQQRKEAFRNEVLLPALQQLVALPEWQQWKASMYQVFPFPEAAVEEFVAGYRPFAERQEQKRKEKEEHWQKRLEAGEVEEGDRDDEEDDEEEGGEGGQGRRRHGGGRGGRGGRGGGGGGWRGGRGRGGGGGRGWGGRRGGRGAW